VADRDGVTASEIAARVRQGILSPRETVQDALDRIDGRDATIGAFQVVRRERALAEADEVAARNDLADLPLAGVPLAVKDNVAVAGEPMRRGSAATSDAPQPQDHAVVRRLRDAGAIVVGMTRVPELCVFAATDSVFGITRNPWDLSRTPGGSSGGSAAAVAAGMVPVAHGNDGMGSIRIPAACCGLVGLKPGHGVVPSGLGPTDWHAMAENGPLATTVADAALVLSVLAGRPELAAVTPQTAPLRIGLALAPPVQGVRLDAEHRRATEETAQALRAAGHTVEELRVPTPTWAARAALQRWFAGTLDDAEQLDRARLERRVRVHARLGSLSRRFIHDAQRQRVRDLLATTVFDRFDVLLTPTLAQPPITAGRWGERGWLANVLANTRYAPYPAPWNLAGYPAASVPAGIHRGTGTPLSVQLVTTPDGESRLLSLAAALEELRPWQRLAPGFR
jgi:amidase